jgi:hypothetical protein
LRELTHKEILALVQFYNYDFGIVREDNKKQRSKKVEEWL